MKKIIFTLFLICIFGCSNDDDKPSNPIDQLPEATQTGRGIFACLVDGKPFIDKSGNPNGISFNAYYQLIDGEYYFGIGGEDDKVNNIILVGLTSNQLSINQNFNYSLVDNSPGNVSGICSFFPNINSQEFSLTNENYTGELKITKFDLSNQIVSGTFGLIFKILLLENV